MAELKLGTRIYVKSASSIERHPDLELTSVFEEFLPDNCILISLPFYKGDYYSLNPKETLYINFLDKDGRYDFMCIVLERVIQNGLHFIKARLTTEIVRSQRRDFYRIRRRLRGFLLYEDPKVESKPAPKSSLKLTTGGIPALTAESKPTLTVESVPDHLTGGVPKHLTDSAPNLVAEDAPEVEEAEVMHPVEGSRAILAALDKQAKKAAREAEKAKRAESGILDDSDDFDDFDDWDNQDEDDPDEPDLLNNVLKVDCITYDISGGGICLYTHDHLDFDSSLIVLLPLGNNGELVGFIMEVMWSRPSGRSDFAHCAGLRFIFDNNQERERMVRYVFEHQREMLQKKRMAGY